MPFAKCLRSVFIGRLTLGDQNFSNHQAIGILHCPMDENKMRQGQLRIGSLVRNVPMPGNSL